MFLRILTRALAAVLPREDYLLPRWQIPRREIVPLRQIVIHEDARFARVINLIWH